MRRRVPRWLIFTAVVVLLALGALAGLVVGTVRRPLPQVSGELSVPGLKGTVEVWRDEYGVPQIYADDAEDLFEAQGFAQAQDRFFEMDLRRHITAGRLSELFGASQVDTDRYLRTLGWRRLATQELGLLSARSRRYLDAYASGVNAYLRSRSPADLSLEYSVLALRGSSYRPEDWTAADSVSWLKAMAWNLGANLEQEIEQARLTARVGARRAAELDPSYPLHDYEPIVTSGAVRGNRFDPQAKPGSARISPAGLTASTLRAADAALAVVGRRVAAMPMAAGDPSDQGRGSNSWVVAGSRTATGHPILENDPHLATSIPSTFAQVGLHCRRVGANCPFDVSGFSFAGVPGVVIGKNATSAWGLTTSYVDAQDLYLEQVRGNTVRDGNRFVPLQVRTEQIAVAGEQPRPIVIRSSRHGPLLSDVDPQLTEVARGQPDAAYAVSLASTALRPDRTMDALFRIDTAATFQEFRSAAELLAAPSQNLVYADRSGTIGYQLAGTVPMRGAGDGLRLSPGWDRRFDWRGTVPFSALPYAENPTSGYLVAANNQIIGGQYPYHLGSNYSYGWRSQQLLDRLHQTTRLSVADAARLQTDETVRFAADLVPTLLKVPLRDPWVGEGQRTLVGWDYRSSADSAAAAFFFVTVHFVLMRTFADELPQDLWPTVGDRWYAVLANLVQDPDNAWWDDRSTPQVERRDDILAAAMTDARKELTTRISRDTGGWQWGKIHRVTLRNPTLGESGVGVIEDLFNRGNDPVGGAAGVVNAMAFDDRVSYQVTTGPTMRMIVDLGDPDRSVWVNQSGVSGHAYAAHYDDQTWLWLRGDTWPFVSSPAAVEASTRDRLRLIPSG